MTALELVVFLVVLLLLHWGLLSLARRRQRTRERDWRDDSSWW